VTSRTFTFLVWGALAAALVVVQIVALTTRRIPTVGGLIKAATRHRAAQLLLLAGWLWLGWHFFVRSSR
jgi:hypothetical protein